MIRLRRWGGLQRTKRHQRLLALPFLISKGVLKPDTHRWAVHIQPWRDRSILCPWNVPVRRESSLSVVVNEIRRKLENAMGHDVVLRASIRRRLSTRIRPRYFDFWPGGGVVEQGAHRASNSTAKCPICLRIPTRQGIHRGGDVAARLPCGWRTLAFGG